MLRQIVSTVAVAGALIATVGSEAVAQTANPCAAKKPAATTPANPCAAKNSEAATSPSAAPKSAVSTQSAQSKSAQSNVFAASEPPFELMRNRTGDIIQAP